MRETATYYASGNYKKLNKLNISLIDHVNIITLMETTAIVKICLKIQIFRQDKDI